MNILVVLGGVKVENNFRDVAHESDHSERVLLCHDDRCVLNVYLQASSVGLPIRKSSVYSIEMQGGVHVSAKQLSTS